MMLTVHALGGTASACVLNQHIKEPYHQIKDHIKHNYRLFFCAFGINILLHGVMDSMPHSHTIGSLLDAVTSMLILLVLLPLWPKKGRIMLLVCFLGALFPDVFDFVFMLIAVGRGIRLFPWHWESIGRELDKACKNNVLNNWYDALAIGICVMIIIGWLWKYEKR